MPQRSGSEMGAQGAGGGSDDSRARTELVRAERRHAGWSMRGAGGPELLATRSSECWSRVKVNTDALSALAECRSLPSSARTSRTCGRAPPDRRRTSPPAPTRARRCTRRRSSWPTRPPCARKRTASARRHHLGAGSRRRARLRARRSAVGPGALLYLDATSVVPNEDVLDQVRSGELRLDSVPATRCGEVPPRTVYRLAPRPTTTSTSRDARTAVRVRSSERHPGTSKWGAQEAVLAVRAGGQG